MSGDAEAGPLVQAALALEAELRRVEALAREAQALPLTSRAHLRRTADKLGELGTAEERMRPCVDALTGAFGRMAERQRELAEALARRGEELRERRRALEVLLEGHAALGRDARRLEAAIRAIGTRYDVSQRPSRAELEPLAAMMGLVIARATELAGEAIDAGFADVAEEVDGLLRQLVSARGRLEAAREEGEGASA